MGTWKGFVVGVALVMAPAAAAAQAPRDAQPAPPSAPAQAAPASQSAQRMFAYLEPSLRVEVVGEAPGTIEVVRGENGVLQVTASAPADGALPAVARSSNDELTLLANGAGPVQYVLVVPRDATVTVARAGHPAVSFTTLDHSAHWSWPAVAGATGELPQ